MTPEARLTVFQNSVSKKLVPDCGPREASSGLSALAVSKTILFVRVTDKDGLTYPGILELIVQYLQAWFRKSAEPPIGFGRCVCRGFCISFRGRSRVRPCLDSDKRDMQI
jgi:hypothetical protein